VSKGLYRIPKEDEVLRIAVEIIREYGVVNSLEMFSRLVNMRARTENREWRISSRRLRRIAAKSKKIKIEVITRESDDELEGNPKCPICGEEMIPELNKTLDGGITALGYVCKHCGYRTDTKRRVPMRYIFRVK
jgi:transposase-like protein